MRMINGERLGNLFRYISADPRVKYVTNGELEAYL